MATNLAALLSAEPSSYMTTGDVSSDTLKRKRRLAEVLAAQGSDFSPVQHWTQGAARVANALVGGLEERKLDREEKRREASLAATLSGLPGLGGGVPAPAAGPAPSGPSAASGAPDYGAAIAGIESGGKYDAQGPVTKSGDRAYGKYQIMGANIPQWTKAHLGTEMTPEAFLASPQAQDAVFKAQFGQYAQKYGPEGAARAWFAGEGGMNDLGRKDQLGTTVGSYGQKFAKALGPQVAALPSATATDGGTGPAPAAPTPAGPQVAQAAPSAPASPAAPAGGIPPQEAAYIRALVANPATRQYGMQIYQAALTRANQPQYGFQAMPDGTVIRTDQRRGTVEPIYTAPTKPTFAEVGTDPQTGQPIRGFVDPVKREVQPYTPPAAQASGPSAIPPVPAGVDPKVWREKHSERATAQALPASDEDASKLRNEIQGLPSYKNLAQAAPVYKSMSQAAGRDTRAADVNLIYGMAKIMDPGSVVKDSEMTVAQAIATLPEQLRNSVMSQMQSTGRLSPDIRAAIMQEAHSRIGSYKEMYDQDMGMYGGIAERRRFNRADVIPDFGKFDPWTPPPAPPAAPAVPAPPIASPSAAPMTAPDADGWRTGPGGVRIREKR